VADEALSKGSEEAPHSSQTTIKWECFTSLLWRFVFL